MSAVPLRLIRGDGVSSPPGMRLVATNPRSSRLMLILLVVAALGVFGVVSVGAKTAESAVQVQTLEGEVDELKQDYEWLTATVAHLESPDRIHQVAVDDLGMVPASEPQFVIVDGQGRFALHDPVGDATVDDSFTDAVKQVLATQP